MTLKKTLTIIGASGHGRVIADAATATGLWNIIDFYDDSIIGNTPCNPWHVKNNIRHLMNSRPNAEQELIIGIGDNKLRQALQSEFLELGWQIAIVIHPRATVSSYSTIGLGTIVMAGAVINMGTTIGAASIINTNSTVDHDCLIAEAVHISPGASLAGNVKVGERSWIGTGAAIINNIDIGEDAIVGAGAVVIRNVLSKSTNVGNPSSICALQPKTK